MSGERVLSVAGDLAAILTAIVAVVFAGHRTRRAHCRRLRLERYLQESLEGRRGFRKHSLIHLAAALGMSEAEAMQAAFASKVIDRSVAWDRDTGRATEIMLSYDADPAGDRSFNA